MTVWSHRHVLLLPPPSREKLLSEWPTVSNVLREHPAPIATNSGHFYSSDFNVPFYSLPSSRQISAGFSRIERRSNPDHFCSCLAIKSHSTVSFNLRLKWIRRDVQFMLLSTRPELLLLESEFIVPLYCRPSLFPFNSSEFLSVS